VLFRGPLELQREPLRVAGRGGAAAAKEAAQRADRAEAAVLAFGDLLRRFTSSLPATVAGEMCAAARANGLVAEESDEEV